MIRDYLFTVTEQSQRISKFSNYDTMVMWGISACSFHLARGEKRNFIVSFSHSTDTCRIFVNYHVMADGNGLQIADTKDTDPDYMAYPPETPSVDEDI